MKKSLFITCFVLFGLFIQAQTEKQFVQAGESAYADGQYYESIAYFENALKFDENNTNSLQKIALAYYEIKDYENAEKYFERLAYDPNFPLLTFYQADNFKLLGKYKEAKEAFQAFYNSYATSDFYKAKAIQEVASCSWAMDQSVNDEIVIEHFQKPLNTGFSDFGAGHISEQLIHVSSLQSTHKNMKDEFESKVFFFEVEGMKATPSESLLFPESLSDSFDVANGFYLAETESFFFSQCTSTAQGEKLCDIYVMSLKGNNWSSPKRLAFNTAEYTETQASAYVNAQGETVLYFVSDRVGGIGKLDIWKSVSNNEGQFLSVSNIGAPINTIDNESTPFFDEASQTLYFSSAWHYGFGGYDIFRSSYEQNTYERILNLGEPLNSSANDQYYYLTSYNHALFASNRTGALQLRGSACCYDIFAHIWEEDDTDDDTDLLVNESTPEEENEQIETFLTSLSDQLPATVYFHNDEPNPKTTASKTNLSYKKCYESYKALKPLYFEEFMDNQAIGAWFNTVDQSYADLQSFLETLLLVLPSTKIRLTIEGYCSPLAMSDYNIKLAQRRIVSLENHILDWNDGILKPYYNAGDLSFTPAPFGEEKADPQVSDSFENVKQSIYNPNAAMERRVAIIGVRAE